MASLWATSLAVFNKENNDNNNTMKVLVILNFNYTSDCYYHVYYILMTEAIHSHKLVTR